MTDNTIVENQYNYYAPIPGFGRYQIHGITGEVIDSKTGRSIQPHLSSGRYLQVKIRSDDSDRFRLVHVHQMVAATFLPPKADPKHEVCHRDGQRLNNSATNLKTASRSENLLDRRDHGTANLTRRPVSKDEIRLIQSSNESGHKLAKLLDRSIGLISQVRNRRLAKYHLV